MPSRIPARKLRVVLTLVILIAAWWWFSPARQDAIPEQPSATTRAELPAPKPLPRLPEPAPRDPRESLPLPEFLPPEAHDTLALIASNGPFPHRQDGSVFQNRERRLPAKPRGYYHEYTVRTPGEDDRGARRIVTGGEPPSEYWYSDDHYRSFRPFRAARSEVPR